jgi:hypothetical protein
MFIPRSFVVPVGGSLIWPKETRAGLGLGLGLGDHEIVYHFRGNRAP